MKLIRTDRFKDDFSGFPIPRPGNIPLKHVPVIRKVNRAVLNPYAMLHEFGRARLEVMAEESVEAISLPEVLAVGFGDSGMKSASCDGNLRHFLSLNPKDRPIPEHARAELKCLKI